MTSSVVTEAPAAAWLTRASTWAVVVWAGAVLYAIALSAESIYRQHHFDTGFDTAVEDQFLWLAAHGHHLFSTVVDRTLVANHFQPGLLLLTPLYWAGLGVSGLLAAQSIALAVVAPALYALARNRGASPRLAAIPALLWLLSPWTANVNLYEFHPEVFMPALLVVGILASLEDRWIVVAATAAVAMSVKEDIPLVYVALGVVLALSGKRRAGAILAVASAGVFVVAHEVVVREGNAYTYFERRFAGNRGDTVGQALVWMLEHPVRTLLDVIQQSGPDIVLLLVATAGLALLAPRWLLLALPAMLHNALSAYPLQHTLRYQYHLLPSIGLFIAAAVGVSAVARFPRPRKLAFGVAAGTAALLGVVGAANIHASSAPRANADGARIRAALALIPPDAPVATSIVFAPHLSHRVELYTFPEPFISIPWGGSSTPAELARKARDVRFVVFASDNGPIEYPRMQRVPAIVLRQGFAPIYRSGRFVVLERKQEPG